MESIKLFYPNLYKKEWLSSLEKVFSDRWLGQGPLVDKFEKAFAKKFRYRYCLGLNSGSASLELAYHLIGIKKGDEVLTAVFTCTATNIPLIRMGAKLKFLDINEELTIDYEDVKKKISTKTKALVVVTLGGMPIDKRIFTLARKYKVPVVIDACQSLGIREQQGDYICYSFQAIKHFTTGDGGMLVLRNKAQYERAKKLRWFGIDREKKKKVGWKTLVNHKMAMEIEESGYKFYMNDIMASMGLVGLRHTDNHLKNRQAIVNLYKTYLPNFKVIAGGACWLVAILVDDREKLIKHLRRKGIECDLVQLRNDIFEVFGGKKQNLPNMNRLEDKYLYLPITAITTTENLVYIINTLNLWQEKNSHK